jgi:hypothetical protein
MNTWFCINCNSCINLDKHGRCPTCGSDAVDIAVRPIVTPESLLNTYIEDLEKLCRLE